MFLKRLNLPFLFAAALGLFQACVIDNHQYDRDRSDSYRGGNIVHCGGGHRISLVDLDISPDPIRDDQYVERFRVRLRADGSGECDTTITIRDGDRVVARTETSRLRPGVNTITLTPSRNYKFEREDNCFQVMVDIDKTSRRLDAQRRFCAKRQGRDRWTLN